VPRDRQKLRQLVDWVVDENCREFPHIPKDHVEGRRRELRSNPAAVLAEFPEWEQRMYRSLCESHRVYCLAERCDNSLMWSHYTDSHKGICLEFDARADPFIQAAKVIYRKTYPEFDITKPGYEPLITKSDVWAYEHEWRIISEERTGAQSTDTIKTDDGFLTLPPGVLKSIIIGCQAPEKSRELVANLVHAHAPEVLVRQATLTSDSYDLVIP
jgi:hypothetical protein